MSSSLRLLLTITILCGSFACGCEGERQTFNVDPTPPGATSGVQSVIIDDALVISYSPGDPSSLEEIRRAVRDRPEVPSRVVLEVGKEAVTAELIREVRNIPEVTGLSLVYSRIDAPALAELVQLDNLTSLHLQDVTLPDNFARELPKLKHLTALELSKQNRSDDILKLLGKTKLSRLELRFCELTESLCEAIARHESLETLELLQVATAPDLDPSALSGLASLKTLEVTVWDANWKLTDFAFLGKIGQLANVSLRTGVLLDDGVPAALSNLPHLQSITLSDTEITNAGYRTLMSAGSLRHVTLGSSLVDDDGIASIPLPAQLESLALEYSRVSCAGAVATQIPASLESFSIDPALQLTSVLKTASPQHRKLLTASAQGTDNTGGLRVWDAKTGDLLMFGASWCAGSVISTTPDGTQLIAGQGLSSTNGGLLFLNADTGGFAKRVPISRESSAFAVVSHSADRLAVGTNDAIRLRDLHTGQELLSFALAEDRPTQVTFSPDDRYLTISYQHGDDVEIRDLTLGGKVVQTVEGYSPRFSPDSQLVSVDALGYVYRIGEPKPVAWKTGRFVSNSELLFLQSSHVSGYMLGIFDVDRQQQTHEVHLAGDHLKPWIVAPDVELVAKVEAETIEVVEYRTGKVRCVIKAAASMSDPPLVMITPSVFLGDRALAGSVSQSFLWCDVN